MGLELEFVQCNVDMIDKRLWPLQLQVYVYVGMYRVSVQ